MRSKIAVIGGGPMALFLFQEIINRKSLDMIELHLFESGPAFGRGLPYSSKGASNEHVTNISSNEVPPLPETLADWMNRPGDESSVVKRLLFGDYLEAQFEILKREAESRGLKVYLHNNMHVEDLSQLSEIGLFEILANGRKFTGYELVVLATGHFWPNEKKDLPPKYYASPYPPAKLSRRFNHAVGLRGASLTAIDAIKTLSRANGEFKTDRDGMLEFAIFPGSENFKIVMHTRHALLPAVRIYFDDPESSSALSGEALGKHIAQNDGFVSLDFLFENAFKLPLKKLEPTFYNHINVMTVEDFSAWVLSFRNEHEPFELLEKEVQEARESVARGAPVYWKEIISVLNFSMNFPAKYLSAEDTIRFEKYLAPIISLVIAFVPPSSCEELLALNRAGRLELVEVEDGTTIDDMTADFETFVDCVGQPKLGIGDLPFESLRRSPLISQAKIRYRSGEGFLEIPGLAIDDCFESIPSPPLSSSNLFIAAVSFIAGYNPDYSGLDFCSEAARRIVDRFEERLYKLRLNQ